MSDQLSLSQSCQQRAKRWLEMGEGAKACEAFLEAADHMLLYAREVEGGKRRDAQALARQLIEKAGEAKRLSMTDGTDHNASRDIGTTVVQNPDNKASDNDASNQNMGGHKDPAEGNKARTETVDNRSAITRDIEAFRRTSGTKGSSNTEDRLKFVPVESPNVHFSDIAGLDKVKEIIQLRVIQPILHPELYDRFGKQKNGGILLYGPPGTGKTMIARAIATETGLAFYSVRCSDIVGKSFGDGERNLSALFDAARENGRAIIFFDEFEALAVRRGGNSTVMNRIVPELLSQMDGFQQAEGQLIVLASTNRPWDLDSAVLRPPRMTERIYVGLPDFAARHYLVKHALELLPKQEMPDYDMIADRLDGFNCADIMAFVEKVKEAPILRGLRSGNIDQFITADDIMTALDNARSSVQKSDLEAFSKWEATQN